MGAMGKGEGRVYVALRNASGVVGSSGWTEVPGTVLAADTSLATELERVIQGAQRARDREGVVFYIVWPTRRAVWGDPLGAGSEGCAGCRILGPSLRTAELTRSARRW